MNKPCTLIKKVELLLNQLNCRSYLHHFGPKKFKVKHHLFAFMVMTMGRFSFRRTSNFLRMMGYTVPTFSALCKSRKRMSPTLFQRLMALTAGYPHHCVAIDSTGISKANPSHHFVKRMDRIKPVKSYVKQSSLFDIKRRTFVALRVRSRPRHDIKDVQYLLKRADVQTTLYGDTAYDAESLHEYCFRRGIQTHIKPRKNVRRGFYRRKQMKGYSEREYHQRSLIEAGQGAVKRKYGGYTLAKSIHAIRVEALLKAVAFNLRLPPQEIFN
jgi:hypothetical protein